MSRLAAVSTVAAAVLFTACIAALEIGANDWWLGLITAASALWLVTKHAQHERGQR